MVRTRAWGDSGVMLTIRMLCEPSQRRTMEEKVWERILDAFGGEDHINLAHPTRRIFNNPTEGNNPLEAGA